MYNSQPGQVGKEVNAPKKILNQAAQRVFARNKVKEALASIPMQPKHLGTRNIPDYDN